MFKNIDFISVNKSFSKVKANFPMYKYPIDNGKIYNLIIKISQAR